MSIGAADIASFAPCEGGEGRSISAHSRIFMDTVGTLTQQSNSIPWFESSDVAIASDIPDVAIEFEPIPGVAL